MGPIDRPIEDGDAYSGVPDGLLSKKLEVSRKLAGVGRFGFADCRALHNRPVRIPFLKLWKIAGTDTYNNKCIRAKKEISGAVRNYFFGRGQRDLGANWGLKPCGRFRRQSPPSSRPRPCAARPAGRLPASSPTHRPHHPDVRSGRCPRWPQ